MCPSHSEISHLQNENEKSAFLDGIFKHMHHAVRTVGKRMLPLPEHKKPHLFPAPRGSLIYRKAQRHLGSPFLLSLLVLLANITFSSFRFRKGRLDTSLLTVSALASWKGHGKHLGPNTFSPKTNGCKTRTSKEKFQEEIKVIFAGYLHVYIAWFSPHSGNETPACEDSD